MTAIISFYLCVGLALGWAWIAQDLGLQPHRTLAREFLIVALGWPAILIIAIVALLFSKPTMPDSSTSCDVESRERQHNEGTMRPELTDDERATLLRLVNEVLTHPGSRKLYVLHAFTAKLAAEGKTSSNRGRRR